MIRDSSLVVSDLSLTLFSWGKITTHVGQTVTDIK